MSNQEKIECAIEAINKADKVLYEREDVSSRAYNEASDYIGIVRDLLNQLKEEV